MLLVDHSCHTPAENLALDEILLDEAENASEPREFLRLWEPQQPLVVVGRSSQLAQEVDLEACRRHQIPVLRRSSGGAAIVTGPGCLMYAVVLSYARAPQLRAIDSAHQHVMSRLRDTLDRQLPGIEFRGTCDLTWQGRKFSGNALRCRRQNMLYHGTLLYDLDLTMLTDCLRMPPRMPSYRAGREHGVFVTNLPVSRAAMRAAVLAAFPTSDSYDSWDRVAVERSVEQKFARNAWNAQL